MQTAWNVFVSTDNGIYTKEGTLTKNKYAELGLNKRIKRNWDKMYTE
jgi:hypothetical protein